MGTLGYGMGTSPRPDTLTTPGCITVHRRLRELADAGATHVAAEVSSHALDQGRVDGVDFAVVAFTNLSRDHLDYHGDLERYGEAKAKLILCAGAAHAVINVGDPFGAQLARRLAPDTRLLSVSATGGAAMLRAVRESGGAGGQRVRLVTADEWVTLDTPLLGEFNVENLVVAAGVLLANGHDLADVAAALARCVAPPGRMELVGEARGPRVVVDFAHTPDALERALDALRHHFDGRIWCVFGCGGERDAGKRPLMGSIARRLADRVVVTDDNPRHEDPGAIIAAVLSGGGGGVVEIVRDRALAIRHAISTASDGDVVLIAGKGHESAQIVGSVSRPFSDQAVARRALAERP
jgi:UDP-N-acetylmuramoyl-L-alanyl-D-glutamate--2,6-diaminopimelate ligase